MQRKNLIAVRVSRLLIAGALDVKPIFRSKNRGPPLLDTRWPYAISFYGTVQLAEG